MKPFMRFFWGDWFANTKDLSLAEKGAYIDLIGHYWERGSLPNDDHRLARILSLDVRTFRAKYRKILQQFFDANWRHPRIEDELAFYREKSMKTRKAALQKHAQKHMQMQVQMHKFPSRVRARLQKSDSYSSFDTEHSLREVKKVVANEDATSLTALPQPTPQEDDMPRDSAGNEITDDMRKASQLAHMQRELRARNAANNPTDSKNPLRVRTPDECQPSPSLDALVRRQNRERNISPANLPNDPTAPPPPPQPAKPGSIPVSGELEAIVQSWRRQGLLKDE